MKKRSVIRSIAVVLTLVMMAGPMAAVPAFAKTNKHEEQESQTMNSEYLLPDADKHYIKESDISWMTDTELLLARNEFYARHGRKFDTKFIRKYFESQGWYKGKVKPANFSPLSFNKYEVANIDYILLYERLRAALRQQKKKNKKGERGLIVTGPSSDSLKKYGEVLRAYSGSETADSAAPPAFDIGGTEAARDSSVEIGYCYMDLDGDENPELLVGPTQAQVYGEGAVFGIYTLRDNVPVEVAVSDENGMYYICADGSVRREKTLENGTWEAEYYHLAVDELVLVNVLMMDESRDPDAPWFAANRLSGLAVMDSPDGTMITASPEGTPAAARTEVEMSFQDAEGLGKVDPKKMEHLTSAEAIALRTSYASDDIEFTPVGE